MTRIEITTTLAHHGFTPVWTCVRGHCFETFERGNLRAIVETFDHKSDLLPEPRVYFEVPVSDLFFDEMVKDFVKGDDFFLPPKARRKK